MSNEQVETESSAEDMLSQALAKMRQAYHQHVRETAKDLYERAKEEKMDRESFMDAIHEDLDGDGWVIYTQKAQSVCLVSDNDGAAIDEYGAEFCVTNGAINWSRLAYCALEQDVIEELGSIDGFDINADDLGFSEEAEEEDESAQVQS